MFIKMADYAVIRQRYLDSGWIDPYFKDGKMYGGWKSKPRKNLEPLDWRDELKEFDILISPSGDLRIVREASYDEFGRLSHIQVAIRKCGKFNGGLRIFNRYELKKFKKAELKYRPTQKDYELRDYLIKEKRWIKSEQNFNCINVKQFA
jgi:hypothetical protein